MRLLLAFLALAAGSAAATPTLAQQTARELLREGMQQRGIYSGVVYEGQEDPVWDPASGAWDGLQVSHGAATGGGRKVYLAILRNTTNTSYCIRRGGHVSPRSDVVAQLEYNIVVAPGAHQVLVSVDTTNPVDAVVTVAFWQPDMSLPYDQQCRGVAPTGVVEWSASGTSDQFRGSRR